MEILPPHCSVSACLEWRWEGRSTPWALPLPLQLWSTCHCKVPKHKPIPQVKNKDLTLYRGRYGKEPTCQCKDVREAGWIPGSGRSSGEGNSYPLQYPYLENPMDRGASWVTVRVTKSWTQLKRLSMRAQRKNWYDLLLSGDFLKHL